MQSFPRHIAAIMMALLAMACQKTDMAVESNNNFAMDDIVLGVDSAPVEMIEYASMTCNHCRTFHKTVFPTLKKELIDTGKIRFIFREFPTSPVALSRAQAILARCAGPDAFYPMIDDFLDRQYEIIEAAGSVGAIGILGEITNKHGLGGEEEINACLQNKALVDKVGEIVEQGRNMGVRSTPALFINGTRVPPDKMNLTGIKELVAAEIEPVGEEQASEK